MSGSISKRSILLIAVSILVGISLFAIGPPDITQGEYTAVVLINLDPTPIRQELNITIVEEGEIEYTKTEVSTPTLNVTIDATSVLQIEPTKQIVFEISCNGEILKSEDIEVHIWNQYGFNVTARPTKQSGQTFTVEYQPLVKSKAALLILGVVVVLWFSEGISLVATSLLIPVLIVISEISTPGNVLMHFFDPAVALILGGFMIGRALSKYELDKRLALMILSRSSGTGSGLLITIMGITSFLSMWISNTASAAIMIPIALAMISRIRNEELRGKYGKVLVLGVAYAATLGGVGSLVGSPPNPLAATYINTFLGIQFSFMSWIPFGLPVVIIMLPVIWQWLMIRFKLPKDIEEMQDLKEISEKEYLKLGPMPRQQKIVVVVFMSVILLWLTEKLPDVVADAIGWSGHGISSSIVALMGGLFLLIIGLLDEEDISHHINWSSLLILGSGIALGETMIDTGVSTFIAQQLGVLHFLPSILVVVIIGTLAILITMVASNTGAAVILIPIAIPLAVALNMDPLLLTMVISIAVSMDFALPTGTPPSTIAYSTGEVEIDEMISTGLIVDLMAILVLTLGMVWLWSFFGLVTI